MNSQTEKKKEKKDYTPPKILASYNKQELEKSIKPHGMPPDIPGCGCGCSG